MGFVVHAVSDLRTLPLVAVEKSQGIRGSEMNFEIRIADFEL